MVAGGIINMKENQAILLKAKWTSPGGIFIEDEDKLRSLYWIVYTDGTVKARARYIASGYTGYRKAKLTEENFNELNKLLINDFIHEIVIWEAVGEHLETWAMTLYDEEGNELHKISGYIGWHDKLKEIADLLKSLSFHFDEYGRKKTL